MGLELQTPPFADPFDASNPHHVLETDISGKNWDDSLSEAAAFNCAVLQNHDLFEDSKDMSFTPIGILDHF